MNRKYRILIIEDEAPLITALKQKFTQDGYAVSVAGNGRDGLDSISENRPDLILLDIMMPKMSGLDMLSVLRDDPMKGNIPVVIITNLNAPETLERANQLGVQSAAFLVKANSSLEKIATTVADTLARKVGNRESGAS
ncbi:MAG: hypothetical protein COW24_04170 [Candidatus Kerfeldbacteria bacterium CG15_BIG_FIL_POST_REV_8_21_14_020_45_12]|uniref:Response regulatory domain-containing protein n=1 Tax=Candidatus Kerfeldbacteria bacterium CG15_BIG_FIL_POST_REV_8_21_14_020_45_12 TaxID=2014247 RepID=A0A2M7H348_9BACT|nr:MAG: hypothetical protein COW24_04170 [Candidatus Kerfeldbacteria bacterium CG15_BIG_FIL_POST_REV_8_21_14_020_45_12]PJA94071.1 MAG: hypothetical protein CO132_00035 [Candidatus Kerfeldbacteria bacterium CG_4_9_14_3_um_filter_45_8]